MANMLFDVVGGKRVARLTVDLATLADSSPASPPLSTDAPFDSFRQQSRPPDPNCADDDSTNVHARPGVVMLAGATLINGPLAMHFRRNCRKSSVLRDRSVERFQYIVIYIIVLISYNFNIFLIYHEYF